ncbi:MAG: allantoicase, partial [Cyanobacteria bacterium REEB65]|nr:allantoicase [Cyanobacteria bacterium REEB65]
ATPADLERAQWHEIMGISRLAGGSRNFFAVTDSGRWTHVKLHIYPDGGVARLRVHGEVKPDWDRLGNAESLDLAAIENGGVSLLASDMFFSHKNNLLTPGRAANMGDGWETRRRRGPGHDWIVVRLGAPGLLQEIEVDTNHFKGNYPDRCSIEGALLEQPVPAEFLSSLTVGWTEILPSTKLQADTQHVFAGELQTRGPFSHLRVNIFPDGGISRLRVRGKLVRSMRGSG